VVVDDIDIEGSSLLEAEDDPSVGRHGDAPENPQDLRRADAAASRERRYLAGLSDAVQDCQMWRILAAF
jgi:hypothetical protein